MKYESPTTYLSKDMANVKVFADRQTDKQTDRQAKNYMAPIFRYGGIRTKYNEHKYKKFMAIAALFLNPCQ
jgi:hypothetical protein